MEPYAGPEDEVVYALTGLVSMGPLLKALNTSSEGPSKGPSEAFEGFFKRTCESYTEHFLN